MVYDAEKACGQSIFLSQNLWQGTAYIRREKKQHEKEKYRIYGKNILTPDVICANINVNIWKISNHAAI